MFLGIKRAKGFWIFLIRWRWLLTCLDMFVICCNWVGNDCFRFNATNWGICCLVGLLMRYFRFGYRNILPLKRNPTWFSIYFQTEEKYQNILHLHLQTYRFILKHHVVTYCCYRSRRRHGRRRRHDFHRGLRDPGYQHR